MGELEERLQRIEEQQLFDQRFGEELHEQVLELMRTARGIERRLVALERRLSEIAEAAGDGPGDSGDAATDGDGSGEQ